MAQRSRARSEHILLSGQVVGSNPAGVDFFIIIFIAILTKDFGH